MAYKQKDYPYNDKLSKDENVLLNRLYHFRISHMTKELELPVVKSPCPANGNTRRAEMKDLLRRLRQLYPDANERFLHALQQDHYDLWQKNEADCAGNPDTMDS